MEHIAFFDLEVSTPPKLKIQSIGVWLNGNSWHGTSIYDFEKFQEDAKLLCGHNILALDLPFLASAGASKGTLEKMLWSTMYEGYGNKILASWRCNNSSLFWRDKRFF